MALVQLSCATLKDFDDGRIDRSFSKHLARAAADCYDRPGDAAGRKVTIEFTITPICGQDGIAKDVEIVGEVFAKVPKHRSGKVIMRMGANGALAFNPFAPENPDQGSFLGDE